MSCEELFREIITEFGLCCTFNLLPDVYNKTLKDLNPTWDLEHGYENSPDANMAKNPHMQEKPYRTDIAGLPGGLSFTLDLQVCSDYQFKQNLAYIIFYDVKQAFFLKAISRKLWLSSCTLGHWTG